MQWNGLIVTMKVLSDTEKCAAIRCAKSQSMESLNESRRVHL